MPDKRIEDLRRRVDADPTSIAFAALAEEYRRIGRFQDAVDVCRRGLERHPAYISAKVTLARALIELMQLDEAQQELDAVLRIAPENLAAIRARADVHHRRGYIPEAFDFEAAQREAERETRAPAPAEPVPDRKPDETVAPPVVQAPARHEVNQPARHEVNEPARHEAHEPARHEANEELKRLEAFLQTIVAERRRREARGA
jgi:cellulose synthase operon protein C